MRSDPLCPVLNRVATLMRSVKASVEPCLDADPMRSDPHDPHRDPHRMFNYSFVILALFMTKLAKKASNTCENVTNIA